MEVDPAGRAGWGRDQNQVSNSTTNSSAVDDVMDPAEPVVTAEVAGIAGDLEPSVVDAAVQRAAAAAVAPLRLMAVHAHPDDESSKGAAALAKYAAEGAGVVVVSCTGGERGDVLNPNIQVEGTDIPALRIEEMARAAEILGVAH